MNEYPGNNDNYETVLSPNETPAQPVEAAPVTQNPWCDAGYVPSADASAVPRNYYCAADKKEKRAKRVREKRAGMPAAAIVALCLVCAIIGGLAGAYLPGLLPGRAAAPDDSGRNTAPDEIPAFSAGGDNATPDKVTSTASQTIRRDLSASNGEVLAPDEIYYELAINQVVGITSSITYNYYGRTRSSQVSGSGFIVSEDGYILTNSHVIEDAAESGGEITVLLYDGSEYSAAVVGYDQDNDIGVLKIEATGLKPAAIGDSDALRVGETVYVVGNALGYLEWSMTSGLVSGVDREISAYDAVSGRSNTLNTFQTEATINSGNSGGPVYNARGEVVGVAVASASSQSYAESLNFAIPINTAIDIANDLIDDGVVSGKPYIGILGPDTLSATYAQYYGVVPGVYFQALEAGGPAEKAGMKVGDIIVGLGDKEVASTNDLDAAKRGFHAGDTTTIRVYRSGDYLDLTITFGDMNDATGTTGGERAAQEQPRRQQPDVYDYYDYFSELINELNPFG